MSDRGVDVQSFAGNPLLLGGGQVLQRAHIVEAIGKLDQHDANVVHHGENHLPDVLGLAGFRSHHVEAADLGDAFDQVGDLGTEAFFNSRQREFRVFNNVVQERGGQRGGIQAHVSKDVGHFEEVQKVWLAGAAELGAMAFGGNFVGAAYQPRIFRRAMFAELGEEFFEAGVEFALGSVAAEA